MAVWFGQQPKLRVLQYHWVPILILAVMNSRSKLINVQLWLCTAPWSSTLTTDLLYFLQILFDNSNIFFSLFIPTRGPWEPLRPVSSLHLYLSLVSQTTSGSEQPTTPLYHQTISLLARSVAFNYPQHYCFYQSRPTVKYRLRNLVAVKVRLHYFCIWIVFSALRVTMCICHMETTSIKLTYLLACSCSYVCQFHTLNLINISPTVMGN